MVLTWVFAESCMSAGPKSVAPVSRPATARMTLCIRCSMKGRATTMRMSRCPPALSCSHVIVPVPSLKALISFALVIHWVAVTALPLLPVLTMVSFLASASSATMSSTQLAASASPHVTRTCLSDSSS